MSNIRCWSVLISSTKLRPACRRRHQSLSLSGDHLQQTTSRLSQFSLASSSSSLSTSWNSSGCEETSSKIFFFCGRLNTEFMTFQRERPSQAIFSVWLLGSKKRPWQNNLQSDFNFSLQHFVQCWSHLERQFRWFDNWQLWFAPPPHFQLFSAFPPTIGNWFDFTPSCSRMKNRLLQCMKARRVNLSHQSYSLRGYNNTRPCGRVAGHRYCLRIQHSKFRMAFLNTCWNWSWRSLGSKCFSLTWHKGSLYRLRKRGRAWTQSKAGQKVARKWVWSGKGELGTNS